MTLNQPQGQGVHEPTIRLGDLCELQASNGMAVDQFHCKSNS